MKNLICRMFGHRFSGWEYFADDSCEQVRTCHRDGYKERRQGPHVFGEWKYVNSSCVQMRTCVRDAHKEKRTQHDYVDSARGSTCEQHQVCTRCGNKESWESHSWVKTSESFTLEYGNVASYKCAACGATGDSLNMIDPY